MRNFLVGYSLTLADVTLVVSLLTPLQTVLDSGYRKDSIPNLTRYCQLILEGKAFLVSFGRVQFAKKMLQPHFPKSEDKPQAAAQKPKKAEAPLSSQSTTVSSTPVSTEKEQTWEDKLPEIKNGF